MSPITSSSCTDNASLIEERTLDQELHNLHVHKSKEQALESRCTSREDEIGRRETSMLDMLHDHIRLRDSKQSMKRQTSRRRSVSWKCIS